MNRQQKVYLLRGFQSFQKQVLQDHQTLVCLDVYKLLLSEMELNPRKFKNKVSSIVEVSLTNFGQKTPINRKQHAGNILGFI